MSSVKRKVDDDEVESVKKLKSEDIDLNDLQAKIRELSITIVSDDNVPTEQSRNQLKKDATSLFLTAVKHNIQISVGSFIKCEVDVNFVDHYKNLAADYAWNNNNTKILWELIEADSFFPKKFRLDDLSGDDECSKKIRDFVTERNSLHETIKNGCVDDVINLKFNKKSKYFVNSSNESAAYVAVKNKKYDVYAYLKSIGAEFGRQAEKFVFDKLKPTVKGMIQESMVKFFGQDPSSHIFNLVSKSRSQRLVPNLADTLLLYYQKLNEVPEVSLILKVVQYADYLDVVFDFEKDEVSSICPTASRRSKGETVHKLGRIYIAAGLGTQKEEEVLGTVAHELTHMAMQILFENDYNPYLITDEVCKAFFKNFKDRRIEENIRPNRSDLDPSKILLNAVDNYKPKEHDSELIVRIPHILIQFQCEDGRNWIEQNISDLQDFYKTVVEKKCEEFISQSFLLKPKSIIKALNESIGEIGRVRNNQIFFTSALNLMEIDKVQVFVVNVGNTFLGMLKVLQGIYGKSYGALHHNFLILKFQNFMSHLTEVGQAFFLDGSSWLIIEIVEKPSDSEMNNFCRQILALLNKKSYKKVVLVTHVTLSDFVKIKVESKFQNFSYTEIQDNELDLDSLDAESQTKILQKSVSFQGKSITLEELIPSKQSYKLVGAEIIEDFIEGRKVNIGNEISGLSDLEGAYYSDLIQNINFESLILEMGKSDDCYFIIRSKENNKEEDFRGIFQSKPINTEFFKVKEWNFEGRCIREKIILVNDRFRDEDFKNFCKNNSNKKCYYVGYDNLAPDSLLLKLVYDPDFYVKRKVKKILINGDEINRLINKNNSDMFIFSSEKDLEDENMEEYDNLKCLNTEEAEILFENSRKPGKIVHWFQMEGEHFSWKDSYGPVRALRQSICKKVNADALEEENLVLEIVNRKVVLISDNPGMGKSTTLTKLYEAEPIADSHWIIRINLKDHLKPIKEVISGAVLSIKKIIEFLEKIYPSLKNTSNDKLLEAVLTTGNAISKSLLIAFDGFDELLDESDRKYVINLLKFLKNKTLCKIWITSRLQYKRELEDGLETFAVEFYPLDEEMKTLFVANYLKGRLNLVLEQSIVKEIFRENEESKISVFTRSLLSKMEEIFKKDTEKFIGTPLQLNLVMFGSPDHFKNWIESSISDLDFTYLGKNLHEVYENFIQKKYRIYFNKSNINEETRLESDRMTSENYNKNLAESLVYKRETLRPKNLTHKKIILLIGLIQSQNRENFEFIHFTFREFYFAKIVPKYFSTSNIDEKFVFVFSDIFVKQEFEMIRNFLNVIIRDEFYQKHLKKVTTKILSKDGVMEPYTMFDSALAIAAEEGHANLFKFFYSIYQTMPNYEIMNILNRTLFSYSVIGGKFQTWEVIFDILDGVELKCEWKKFYFQCLIYESACSAAERSIQTLSEFLLSKIKEQSTNERRNFLNFARKKGTICKIIETHTSPDIFELLLKMIEDTFVNEEQPDFLLIPNNYGPNALFAAANKNDPKFMDLLLKKYEQIMDLLLKKYEQIMGEDVEHQLLTARQKSGRTILHVAAVNGRLKTTEWILNKIGKIEFIMASDANGQTALHLPFNERVIFPPKLRKAVQTIDMIEQNRIVRTDNRLAEQNLIEVTRLLINKVKALRTGEQKLRECIKTVDKSKKSMFHLAFKNGKLELIELIFDEIKEKILSEEDMRHLMTSKEPEPILITVCRRNDMKILTFLLEKAEQIIPNKVEFYMSKTKNNLNALHFALEKNNLEMMKLLFEKFDKYLNEQEQIQLLMMHSIWAVAEGPFLVEAASSTNTNIIKYLFEKKGHLLSKSLTPHDIWRIMYSVVYHGSADFIKYVWEELGKCLTPNDKNHLLSQKDTSFANFLQATCWNENEDVVDLVFDKMKEHFNDDKQKELLTEKTTNTELLYINGVLCSDLTYLHIMPWIHAFHFNICNSAAILKNFLCRMKKVLTPEEIFQLMKYQPKTIPVEDSTVLHIVTEAKDTDELKIVLQEMESFTKNQQRELLMSTGKDRYFGNVLTKVCSFRLIEMAILISEKAQEILTDADDLRKFWMNEGSEKTVFQKIVESKSNSAELLHYSLQTSKNILKLEDKMKLFTEKILHVAAEKGEPSVLKTLLDYIEEFFDEENQRIILMMRNGENQTPFHVALSVSNSVNQEFIILLLQKMEKLLTLENWYQLIGIKDDICNSILFITCLLSGYEIVKPILESVQEILKGEFPQFFTLNDVNFGSLLHAAVYNEDSKVVKLILDTAKKILIPEKFFEFLMIPNEDGRTVLHLAASNDKQKIKWSGRENTTLKSEKDKYLNLFKDRSDFVYLMLKEAGEMTEKQRCDFLMLKDKKGKTALHLAVEAEKFESVKLLLLVGEIFLRENLDKFVMETDSENKTALDISLNTSNYFITNLLSVFMAEKISISNNVVS